MSWYLVHTKPRQEQRASANLFNQGYVTWLPQLRVEKVRQRRLVVVDEPLFQRYLFIHLPPGINWSPVRSTLGVTTIVRFGGEGRVMHGGNFYGGHACLVTDTLKNVVANVGDLLDRRTRVGLVPADRERAVPAAERALELAR